MQQQEVFRVLVFWACEVMDPAIVVKLLSASHFRHSLERHPGSLHGRFRSAAFTCMLKLRFVPMAHRIIGNAFHTIGPG